MCLVLVRLSCMDILTHSLGFALSSALTINHCVFVVPFWSSGRPSDTISNHILQIRLMRLIQCLFFFVPLFPLPLSLSSNIFIQVPSSQCWRSCCLSPQSRTIPAGWSSRQHTAVPAKSGSWCRSILTRLVQHFFSLLQPSACYKGTQGRSGNFMKPS